MNGLILAALSVVALSSALALPNPRCFLQPRMIDTASMADNIVAPNIIQTGVCLGSPSCVPVAFEPIMIIAVDKLTGKIDVTTRNDLVVSQCGMKTPF